MSSVAVWCARHAATRPRSPTTRCSYVRRHRDRAQCWRVDAHLSAHYCAPARCHCPGAAAAACYDYIRVSRLPSFTREQAEELLIRAIREREVRCEAAAPAVPTGTEIAGVAEGFRQLERLLQTISAPAIGAPALLVHDGGLTEEERARVRGQYSQTVALLLAAVGTCPRLLLECLKAWTPVRDAELLTRGTKPPGASKWH